MKKAKVTMRNWEPYVYDGEYNLSGTADVHPRLGRNVYVATTSTLVKASLEEDVLIYETRNTVYHCPLKYMMVSPYGNVVQEYREELARLDTSENALDRIIAAAAKMSLGEPEDMAELVEQYPDVLSGVTPYVSVNTSVRSGAEKFKRTQVYGVSEDFADMWSLDWPVNGH